MYFLKKICGAVIDPVAGQELAGWAQRYKDVVEYEGVLGDARRENTAHEALARRVAEMAEGQGSDSVGKEGLLWITDDAASAVWLRERGGAVLAYLHDGNGGQNFSCCKYAMMNPRELDAEYFELIYRRLKRLSWDILETDRCLLRESTAADVPAFFRIYQEPMITEHMENLFPTREEETAYIEDYIDKVYSFYDFGVWTVLEKATGQVIGRAGLSYREGFEEPELGFVIGVPWQGQGIAYEICRAILDYGSRVLEFDRVQAFVEPGNEPSIALCGKLGFRERERVFLDGKEHIRFYRELT